MKNISTLPVAATTDNGSAPQPEAGPSTQELDGDMLRIVHAGLALRCHSHVHTDDPQTPRPDAGRDTRGVDAHVTERTLRIVDAALAHPSPFNRHHTAMLYEASDWATTYAIYSLLNHFTAKSGTWPSATDPDLADLCLDCWLECFIDVGLLEPCDELALDAALTSVARRVAGFPIQLTEEENYWLTYEPKALVRAAYALARGLVA
jgi:hypothetical protein